MLRCPAAIPSRFTSPMVSALSAPQCAPASADVPWLWLHKPAAADSAAANNSEKDIFFHKNSLLRGCACALALFLFLQPQILKIDTRSTYNGSKNTVALATECRRTAGPVPRPAQEACGYCPNPFQRLKCLRHFGKPRSPAPVQRLPCGTAPVLHSCTDEEPCGRCEYGKLFLLCEFHDLAGLELQCFLAEPINI